MISGKRAMMLQFLVITSSAIVCDDGDDDDVDRGSWASDIVY